MSGSSGCRGRLDRGRKGRSDCDGRRKGVGIGRCTQWQGRSAFPFGRTAVLLTSLALLLFLILAVHRHWFARSDMGEGACLSAPSHKIDYHTHIYGQTCSCPSRTKNKSPSSQLRISLLVRGTELEQSLAYLQVDCVRKGNWHRRYKLLV